MKIPCNTEHDMLRMLTCGSVDDGKSTLIGRMLYDSGILYEDQLLLLEKERTAEGFPDFSCLLDGLMAEQEQAITIDVAYRSFTLKKRRYLVADAPGHEQYTRNMVSGASHADVALLLVDATKGLLSQTRRHTCILSLLGISDVIVAVNKMDCLDYAQEAFITVETQYRQYAEGQGFRSITCIPVSALRGDNVCSKSAAMPWYDGPALMDFLENIKPPTAQDLPFCMPVQWVALRPGFRGLAGTIMAGKLAVGQEVSILPSGNKSTVKQILTFNNPLDRAKTEQAICVRLTDELDVGRGDMLTQPDQGPEVAHQFAARMIWLGDPPLVTGRSYLFRLATAEAQATIMELSSRLNLETLQEDPVKELSVNEVGRVKIALDRPLPMAPYHVQRALGGFLLVDRISGATVGAGMIEFPLRRSHTIFPYVFELGKTAYAAQKGQKPYVIWFTGLSASGKSTLANLVSRRLFAMGRHIYTLDGDNLRGGLNQDLGFTEPDRAENIRRAAEVAHILTDAGLIVLATFISPYKADRCAIRKRFEPGEFWEIFVDTPLAVCEARDPKGLYQRARAGTLPNFTGISAPFEAPEAPDLHLDGRLEPEILAEQVLVFLAQKMETLPRQREAGNFTPLFEDTND